LIYINYVLKHYFNHEFDVSHEVLAVYPLKLDCSEHIQNDSNIHLYLALLLDKMLH